MESPIQIYLHRIHDELSGLKDGTADSILSSLSGTDPDSFGICLATADGHLYEAGDTRQEFTIQSISKPFTYGLALADLGMEAVDGKIDVEPSGEAYNEISLAEGSGRPANAMINAGAITSASLVKGRGGQTRFQRIHKTFSAFAGRQLGFDDRIFANELKHGHRNRALAHLLRSFDIIEAIRNSRWRIISAPARLRSAAATLRSWQPHWPTTGAIRSAASRCWTSGASNASSRS
jgi:glutaminase